MGTKVTLKPCKPKKAGSSPPPLLARRWKGAYNSKHKYFGRYVDSVNSSPNRHYSKWALTGDFILNTNGARVDRFKDMVS